MELLKALLEQSPIMALFLAIAVGYAQRGGAHHPCPRFHHLRGRLQDHEDSLR